MTLRQDADRHLYAAETFKDIAEKLPQIVAAGSPEQELQTVAIRSILLRVAECEINLASKCLQEAQQA